MQINMDGMSTARPNPREARDVCNFGPEGSGDISEPPVDLECMKKKERRNKVWQIGENRTRMVGEILKHAHGEWNCGSTN